MKTAITTQDTNVRFLSNLVKDMAAVFGTGAAAALLYNLRRTAAFLGIIAAALGLLSKSLDK